MAKFQDHEYLLNDQYKDATNFSARVNLRRRFSTNKQRFSHWAFEQIQPGEGGKVLELGCGPGLLWWVNRERIPASWQIVLSDFSPGMLQAARNRLGEERFNFQVVDAQAIPFADESFDAVIANHMLYHMPDLPRALSEIRRVLKPGGQLYATTFGKQNLHEMNELLLQACPDIPQAELEAIADNFGLENGQSLLAPFFAQVRRQLYEDALRVTEAQPVVDYVFSGSLGAQWSESRRGTFKARIEQELAAHDGVLTLSTSSGMFIAHKAR